MSYLCTNYYTQFLAQQLIKNYTQNFQHNRYVTNIIHRISNTTTKTIHKICNKTIHPLFTKLIHIHQKEFQKL